MGKKIIILNHGGGRLGNQLWNYISVFAYCLENNYTCYNYSFYKYDQDFNIRDKNLFYRFFLLINKITYAVKKNRIAHWLYRMYIKIIEIKTKNKIIDSGNDPLQNGIFYLPPTPTNKPNQIEALNFISNQGNDKIYFKGWLFRNPIGLEKYRQEIQAYFRPKKEIQKQITSFINKIKSKYEHLVGVHMRQGDYKKGFRNGELYFSEKEVNIILNDYLKIFKKEGNKTCFVVCSDEAVELNYFTDLNIIKSRGSAVEDLFLLAATDTIIGADSTFGALASYFGNIPLITFQRPKIDWDYYANKKTYFENKYSTFVNY